MIFISLSLSLLTSSLLPPPLPSPLLSSPLFFLSYSIVFTFLPLNEASQTGLRSTLGSFWWKGIGIRQPQFWVKNFALVSGSHSGLPLSKPHVPPGLPLLVPASSIHKGRQTLSLSGAVLGSSIWISIIHYQSPFCFDKFLTGIPSIHIARNSDLSSTHKSMFSSAYLHIHVFNWPHVYKTGPPPFATCLAFFFSYSELHQQIQPPNLLKVTHALPFPPAQPEWNWFPPVASHLTNHVSSLLEKLSFHGVYLQSPWEWPLVHAHCLSFTSEQQ